MFVVGTFYGSTNGAKGAAVPSLDEGFVELEKDGIFCG